MLMKSSLPLLAILRGVTPNSVLQVADILVDAGFSRIEVPLNSPDALSSIRLLTKEYKDEFLIGAGTVTSVELAKRVIDTGANLIVSPNLNIDLLRLALKAGCHCYPGVLTPSECFAAIAAGASNLKLFPISTLGIEGFKAIKSVLPTEIDCYPVGGIQPENMHGYLAAGAAGFGLGSALYQANMELDTLSKNAQQFVKSFHEQI